jgi:phospholipid/cholesterol/gamma-HCH transport system substrate-binding protein
VRLLERLPESMTDQTRTGTYGSWYNYYLCAFAGRIQLPLIEGIPGIGLINKQLSNLSFRSPAARCQT